MNRPLFCRLGEHPPGRLILLLAVEEFLLQVENAPRLKMCQATEKHPYIIKYL
jgi:hypothetical protein